MPTTECGCESILGGATGAELLTFYGPTLPVNIGFDPDYIYSSRTPPEPGVTGVNALVDTGASVSYRAIALAFGVHVGTVQGARARLMRGVYIEANTG